MLTLIAGGNDHALFYFLLLMNSLSELTESGKSVFRQSPLVTILVTTYNRASCLESCLAQISSQVKALPRGEIEVVVSNNHSTDHTGHIIERYRAQCPFIVEVMPQSHLPSAEENLFSALPRCRGEYVWPFGDDDFLTYDAVASVLELIKRDPYDFYLLNSAYVSTEGTVLADRLIPMGRPSMVLTMVELVQAVGLITIAASFTSTIIRREPLLAVNPEQYADISPIYAHVAAYIAAFAETRCLVVNQQWVTLRAGTGLASFQSFARKKKCPTYAPWTLGLCRLLKRLEAAGKIPSDLIFNTLECDAARFWTWANNLSFFCRQLELYAASLRSEEFFTLEDFYEYRSMFANSGPFVFEVFVKLERIYRTLSILKAIESDSLGTQTHSAVAAVISVLPQEEQSALVDIVRDRVREDLAIIMRTIETRTRLSDIENAPRVGTYGAYDVHRVGIWYFAVSRDGQNKPAVVECRRIDPGRNYPHWISARSVDDLKRDLEEGVYVTRPEPYEEYRGYYLVETPDGVSAVSGKIAANLRSQDIKKIATVDLDDLVYQAVDAVAARRRIDSAIKGLSQAPVVEVERTIGPDDMKAYFVERWYLAQYPEGASAVKSSEVSSAFDHFLGVGLKADFRPCIFFDSARYRARYSVADPYMSTPD